LKKHYEEFCLFNTWVIMRIVVHLSPTHPWHNIPPDLEDWFKNSTPLNIRISHSMTIVLILAWELIIFGIIKLIKGVN